MATTKLSTRGQIVLPKRIRTARAWGPGTEFSVEETPDGILLRPRVRFAESSLEDVAGCLRAQGRPKTLSQMRSAIEHEVKRRHDRGRY